jgi:hypothetical protein
MAGPDEITDVGTLNGSTPQLGAPSTKLASVLEIEQKMIALELPLVAPGGLPGDEDGLDEVPGAAVTSVPARGLLGDGPAWA